MSTLPRGVRSTSAVTLWLALVFVLLLAARLLRQNEPSVGDVVRQQEPQAVERVIDGDTLRLSGGHRVRLIGVDTPETVHPEQPVDPLGREAAEFVRSVIGDEPVRLEFDRQRLDRYGRLLAYVWLADGRLLNVELIRAGFSVAETGYPYRRDMKQRFLEAEAEARADCVGRWQSQATTRY